MTKRSDAAVLAAIAGKTTLIFQSLGGRISPQDIDGALARAQIAVQKEERVTGTNGNIVIPVAAGTNGATVAPRKTAQRK